MIRPTYLSFSSGLISLAGEILWMRLFGFVNYSTPKAVGFVLFAYLLGIAMGAALGKRYCSRLRDDELLQRSGYCLALSGLAWVLLPWLFVLLPHGITQLIGGALIMIFSAAVLAVIFPIAHHLGVRGEVRMGKGFSSVYAANVMGAALGPILIGWVGLQWFTLQQCFILLALAAFALAARFLHHLKPRLSMLCIAFSIPIAVICLPLEPHALIDLGSKQVIETRQGIIAVVEGGQEGDFVYGGNVYDGRTNLDGDINSNGIHRILITNVLKPRPQRVLVVGMSIGTWLTLATAFEGVEHIDVIEINPGYKQAALAYPPQKHAMQDRRVNLVFDDARRWLRLHPEAKYDLILMNTTWHWRAYSTLLLSQDFFRLVHQHLKPEGLVALNTTGSMDVAQTASQVFPYIYKLNNFIYGSESDLQPRLHQADAEMRLASIKVQGKDVFKPGSEMPREILQMPFLRIDPVAGALAGHEIITDDNMLVEFRRGLSLLQ